LLNPLTANTGKASGAGLTLAGSVIVGYTVAIIINTVTEFRRWQYLADTGSPYATGASLSAAGAFPHPLRPGRSGIAGTCFSFRAQLIAAITVGRRSPFEYVINHKHGVAHIETTVTVGVTADIVLIIQRH
jgi:hypothetical protein